MNKFAFSVGKVLLPPVGWLMCASKGHGGVAWTETKNKLFIIDSVEFADQYLGRDSTLAEKVERIYSSDPFRALWLAEGVGLHYGMAAIAKSESPRGILKEGEGKELPPPILLMTHAGMSMAFVRHFMDKAKTGQAVPMSEVASRVSELLHENSLEGYRGLAFEAFGMVVRFFYGLSNFRALNEAMEKVEPDYVPNLWHGVGRALYFVSFLPKFGDPWPSLKLIESESLGKSSRQNLTAGLSSAITMVNMRAPEVLEAIIRSRVVGLDADQADAFFHGMICSVIFRLDTTPGETSVDVLAGHQPAADFSGQWNTLVRDRITRAAKELYPLLGKRKALDEVCYYQPTEELFSRAGAKP